VLCLGIDRLTNINTMYGRNAGDGILVEIANVLKTTFRENALVSRFEGDKFAIYFSKMKQQEDFIRGIVRKASEAISDHPFIIDGQAISVTASIGVSIYPNDSEDPEEIVKNSEAAMYIAKDQGENTFSLFDTRMYSDMLARIQLERELQEAIEKCQFYVYYQPKVDGNGKIMGMESLIRWDSPQRGMVWPADFIPVIEKNGMIHDIGAIVLRKSLDQARKLKEKGLSDLMIAVNLSPIQFSHPDIIRLIEESIIQSGYDPYWLELEITESSIMKEERDSIHKLRELHDMGISIAIDDFGTGYSSLSKLKDYPIDTLKIDKTFVESLPLNRKSAALASTIIDLGHNLNFKVVAEGVETREQVDFLIQQGCDFFQGNYFSKPLSYDDLEIRIKKDKGVLS
jgi:diguanylate cyclase (GGDEF)-like protein